VLDSVDDPVLLALADSLVLPVLEAVEVMVVDGEVILQL